jgi:hypothetical protein
LSTVKTVPKSEFVSFVRKYLVVEGLPCARHCDKTTHFVPLMENRDKIIGAYTCPDNYVSRIVAFELKQNNGGIPWLIGYVRNELEGGSLVRDKDFRSATRHGWELGGNAEEEIKSFADQSNGIKEYYWTFYARSDDEKKIGNFLCEKCGKLFTQPMNTKNKICQRH